MPLKYQSAFKFQSKNWHYFIIELIPLLNTTNKCIMLLLTQVFLMNGKILQFLNINIKAIKSLPKRYFHEKEHPKIELHCIIDTSIDPMNWQLKRELPPYDNTVLNSSMMIQIFIASLSYIWVF